jgi:DNA-binding response OmpR family regulator
MLLAHRILVVEDEQVLAQNVKTYLGRRSADVRIARDGRRAMEMIASFTPDVVVLGYQLSGENGLQIYTEMVRHRTHPMGCVMITGYPLEKITQSANKLGIHYLLSKPFSLAELQQLIDRSAEIASRDWRWPIARTSGTGCKDDS